MNKKTKLISMSFVLAITGALALMTPLFANVNKLMKSSATDPHVLVLDESNQPTIVSSTEANDNNITDWIQFGYSGTSMSVKSGRHIIMGSGRIETKKPITGITQIKVTAPVNTNNLLVLYVGYSQADLTAKKYAYSIYGTSEYTVDVSCNYFALSSSSTFGISNVTITYDCPTEAVAPAGNDKLVATYGGSNKEISYDGDIGKIKDAQSYVTNAAGVPYNYEVSTFQIDFKFNSSLLASTNDTNFGLQIHKYNNSNGSVNAAFQFGITNFSTGAWAVKVSGTTRDSGSGLTLNDTDWFTFKTVITKNGSDYILKCYINDTEISSTTRGSLGKSTYYYGVRFGNGSLGYVQFKNLSLTGSN